MKSRWVTVLVVVALVLVGFVTLAWVGPPGQASRANSAYASCSKDAAALGTLDPDGQIDSAWYAEQRECSHTHCDDIRQPTFLENVGLFIQTRLNGDAASCVSPPTLRDIVGFGGGNSIRLQAATPRPTVGDDADGLIDAVAWGYDYPDTPPNPIDVIEQDEGHVELAVAGNGCEPIVTVDALQGASSIRLRIQLDDETPAGLECPDVLMSYPITITFTQNIDPDQLRIEVDDRRPQGSAQPALCTAEARTHMCCGLRGWTQHFR